MGNLKIIGLMLTWNNLEFFRCAVEQALEFCDELILVEGCHSIRYQKRSDDGTVTFIQALKTQPKLKVVDFRRGEQYDFVQRVIRQRYPKTSHYYQPGNWVFHWDDDLFFFEKDLEKIKNAMEHSKEDALDFNSRYFLYNFRFNCLRRSGIYCYRIVEGLKFKVLMTAYYADGRRYSIKRIDDITVFHYGCVKKPERQRARWVMSVEKGSKASVGRFDKWMGISWERDEDIFKSANAIKELISGDAVNIYEGEHPEALASHPWRHIDDVRRVE